MSYFYYYSIIYSHSIYDEGISQNPHGKLTQLYFWARILSDKEMADFTGNCSFVVDKTGNLVLMLINIVQISIRILHNTSKLVLFWTDMYFDWESISDSSINRKQMTIKEGQLEDICQENKTTTLLLAKSMRYCSYTI